MDNKVQSLMDRVRSFIFQYAQIEDAVEIALEVDKAVEEAYKLGQDEANASWQSTMSEALNSGPGYYKP